MPHLKEFSVSTPRKPSELRILQGNPGKRPIPNAPAYPPLIDAAPEHLDDAGREMWTRITTALATTRVVQQTDFYALTALCDMWSLYRAALADVTARGHLIAGSRDEGALVKNPSCLEASRALTAWMNLAARFGLTPSDRAGLDVEKIDAEPNPLEEIIAASRRDRAQIRRRNGFEK